MIVKKKINLKIISEITIILGIAIITFSIASWLTKRIMIEKMRSITNDELATLVTDNPAKKYPAEDVVKEVLKIQSRYVVSSAGPEHVKSIILFTALGLIIIFIGLFLCLKKNSGKKLSDSAPR